MQACFGLTAKGSTAAPPLRCIDPLKFLFILCSMKPGALWRGASANGRDEAKHGVMTAREKRSR
jgi:hypothetical protein